MPTSKTAASEPLTLHGRTEFPENWDKAYGHIVGAIKNDDGTPRVFVEMTAIEARALANLVTENYDPKVHNSTLRHLSGELYRLAETVCPRPSKQKPA